MKLWSKDILLIMYLSKKLRSELCVARNPFFPSENLPPGLDFIAYDNLNRQRIFTMGCSPHIQSHPIARWLAAIKIQDAPKLGRELQNEIAQTQLGINVRLPAVKRGARTNMKGLKNDMASKQGLVIKSAQSVRRFARKVEVHQPVNRGLASLSGACSPT